MNTLKLLIAVIIIFAVIGKFGMTYNKEMITYCLALLLAGWVASNERG